MQRGRGVDACPSVAQCPEYMQANQCDDRMLAKDSRGREQVMRKLHQEEVA